MAQSAVDQSFTVHRCGSRRAGQPGTRVRFAHWTLSKDHLRFRKCGWAHIARFRARFDPGSQVIRGAKRMNVPRHSTDSTSSKRVYLFGGGKADGTAQMKELLGGKGANLAEM